MAKLTLDQLTAEEREIFESGIASNTNQTQLRRALGLSIYKLQELLAQKGLKWHWENGRWNGEGRYVYIKDEIKAKKPENEVLTQSLTEKELITMSEQPTMTGINPILLDNLQLRTKEQIREAVSGVAASIPKSEDIAALVVSAVNKAVPEIVSPLLAQSEEKLTQCVNGQCEAIKQDSAAKFKELSEAMEHNHKHEDEEETGEHRIAGHDSAEEALACPDCHDKIADVAAKDSKVRSSVLSELTDDEWDGFWKSEAVQKKLEEEKVGI